MRQFVSSFITYFLDLSCFSVLDSSKEAVKTILVCKILDLNRSFYILQYYILTTHSEGWIQTNLIKFKIYLKDI